MATEHRTNSFSLLGIAISTIFMLFFLAVESYSILDDQSMFKNNGAVLLVKTIAVFVLVPAYLYSAFWMMMGNRRFAGMFVFATVGSWVYLFLLNVLPDVLDLNYLITEFTIKTDNGVWRSGFIKVLIFSAIGLGFAISSLERGESGWVMQLSPDRSINAPSDSDYRNLLTKLNVGDRVMVNNPRLGSFGLKKTSESLFNVVLMPKEDDGDMTYEIKLEVDQISEILPNYEFRILKN